MTWLLIEKIDLEEEDEEIKDSDSPYNPSHFIWVNLDQLESDTTSLLNKYIPSSLVLETTESDEDKSERKLMDDLSEKRK